jgi:ParB family chromosome partitioning protein
MQSIVTVSPFRCRMWSLHDRLESHIDEKTCRAEIESISRSGQLIPALGRPLREYADYDVEIVCGARRLFAARHLNKPLLVELRDLTDKDAIVAMDIENRQRRDVSPYERGLSYARWLRAGLFQSQDDIARALGISTSQVSRLLKLARLPSVIVAAFNRPLEICEGWGLDLLEALEDPHRRQPTVQAARAVGRMSPRPSAREVYRHLLTATVGGRKAKTRVRDEVVKAGDGTPLFRIKHQTNSIAVLLPVEKVSAKSLEAIRQAICGILQDATPQVLDPPTKKAAQADGEHQLGAGQQRGLVENSATMAF